MVMAEITICQICNEPYINGIHQHKCRGKKPFIKKCINCGNEFETYNKHKIYCSKTCCKNNNKDWSIKNKDRIAQKKICEICNTEFITRIFNQKLCSKECAEKARVKNYIYSFHQIRFKVFHRDQFTCIYCGRTSFIDNIELHLEHIVSRNKNGDNTINNYATSCKDCNLSKSDIRFSKQLERRILNEIKKRNSKIDIQQSVLPFFVDKNEKF